MTAWTWTSPQRTHVTNGTKTIPADPGNRDFQEIVFNEVEILDPPEDDLVARLITYCVQRKWLVETRGCPWNGRIILTDRENSQPKLIAEMVALIGGLRQEGSTWTFQGDAEGVPLSNAEALSMILAARTHIATAYAVQAQVVAAIKAGTITTTQQIDAAGWPSNT